MSENTELWTYYPGFVKGADEIWPKLYEALKVLCKEYTNIINGKEYPSRRASCVFKTVENLGVALSTDGNFNYGRLPVRDWKECSLVEAIREQLRVIFNVSFDYCLAHIYRTGKDVINWHNDREAMNTPIVSISFGHPRKFRFKKVGQTKGWTHEYSLGNGDCILMHVGCQQQYVHCVPQETTVTEPRINLTFRLYDVA
jgi:hypothetical protein